MEKEYKYKVFYIDKANNNLGWQCQSDDISEVIKDSKTLQQEYAVVTQNEIQTVDNQVNANEGLDFGNEKLCKKCNSPMKQISAGISKRTGKPFNAFWACENKQCGNTEN